MPKQTMAPRALPEQLKPEVQVGEALDSLDGGGLVEGALLEVLAEDVAAAAPDPGAEPVQVHVV